MPLLATMLLSLFTQIASFFGMWMSKKIAFAVAAVTTFGFLTVGLFTALGLLIGTVVQAFPSGPVLSTFLWLALPPAVPVGIAATIACDTAIALYAWNVENLRLASYVT